MCDLDLLQIAEKFEQWLKETAEYYGLAEDDLQDIIRSFLI